MTDKSQAIQVTTEVEVDWAELGRIFADESSPKQAEFLMGFYEAVQDSQLAFIGAEKIFNGDRADVARVVEDLAAFIREPA
ncbi:hypothetical protein MRBLMI12_000473 [Microbacterium sp. LMI12-1-1.1]|uniref:hypothetical protein n=1 Tax=Microbacterium sp. LMI12-1-1.1 TaxID=3135225 RepID=UPI003437401D